MPPRKRPQAAPPPFEPKAPAKRRSKLAKDNAVSAAQEDEIREAFGLFTLRPDDYDDGDPDATALEDRVIETKDLRRCLIALNAPPRDSKELDELVEATDDEGLISFDRFFSVAAMMLNQHAKAAGDDADDARAEEVHKAFLLFTKGQDRDIGLHDLKRVAKELKEDVPEAVLKDMLREATGGGVKGVGLEDFEGVMSRAGVFAK